MFKSGIQGILVAVMTVGVITAITSASMGAWAEVSTPEPIYKWIDERGTTHYSDERPQISAPRDTGIPVSTPTPASTLKPALDLHTDSGRQKAASVTALKRLEPEALFELPEINLLSSSTLNDFPDLALKPLGSRPSNSASHNRGRAVLIHQNRGREDAPAYAGDTYGFPYRYSYNPYSSSSSSKYSRYHRQYPAPYNKHRYQRGDRRAGYCSRHSDCRRLTGGQTQHRQKSRLPGVKIPANK